MSTYREIVGKKIKKVSSDPSDGLDGQMWYNSTTGTLRGLAISDAFISGSSLSNARLTGAGAGSQTASLIAGGQTPPGSATTLTEEYNGSGWATGGALNTARYYLGGAGTQTSALATSGRNPPVGWSLTNNEKYDGSSWTNSTASPTALNQVTSTGTQTASLLWGGQASPGGSHVDTTYEFDGSSWTTGGALPAGVIIAGAFGTQTAAMSAGNKTGTTLYYNGASWSDQSSTVPYGGPTYMNYAGTSGTQTAGILMGGGPSANTTTAKWDGSTWSSNPAMAQQRNTGPMGPIGTSTAGLIAGGYTGTVYTALTEEYHSSTNVVTAGAWASGTALGTARYGQGQFGPQTAAVAAAGSTAPATANVESYDGSSWTEGPNVNTARGLLAAAGNGTQTAGLIFGGTTSISPHNPGITNASEEYDGSSWTTGNNLNFSSRNLGGLGVQTSAVAAGGVPGAISTTGEYDGTNWTAGTSLPAGLQDNQGMTGASQTTGLLFGGETGPGPATANTFEYDGTNWTASNALLSAVYANAGCGTQTAALSFGGQPGPHTTQTEGYDGTAWSTRPSLATAKSKIGGSGTNTAGLCVGGLTNPGAVQDAVEEFTAETTAANIENFTTS